MDMTRQSEQDVLLIGIDKGTTNCSVSHALLDHNERTAEIRLGEFPINDLHIVRFSGPSGGLNQVKTQMAWLSEREDFLWGDEVDEAFHNGDITDPDSRIELLKLALETRDEKTERQRTVIQRQLECLTGECGEVSILDLISIFLRKLFAYIMGKIRKARGNEIVDNAKLDCILSVPASWGFVQRETMIKAAEIAGLPALKLVSEPEAAAIFCMHERLVRQPALRRATNHGNPTSEGLLVLDAGGGTVDIITYIAEMGRLRGEGAAGTGKTCGSVFLNWGFRDFLERHLKDDMVGILQGLRKPICESSKQAVLDAAVADFEARKTTFNGGNLTIRIHGIKAIPGKGIHDGYIVIPSIYIRQIFDRNLNKIIRMTRKQIRAFNRNNAALDIVIHYILFVGGYSGSPYAQGRLSAEFGPRGIEVRTPHEDSSTLISRGAILRSLYQDSIGEYYLRGSYGVARDEEYDRNLHTERYCKAVHGERKVYRDYHDGHEIVQRRVHWFFKAGSKVTEGTVRKVRGYIGAPLRGKIEIEEKLYCSEYETNDSLPVSDPENDIEEVQATIKFTIPEVEGMGYRAKNPRTGEVSQRIEYEVLMTFYNPRGKFEMIIPDGGKFPDEVSWGKEYQRHEAVIHLAAALFLTPAPVNAGAAVSGSSQRGHRRFRAHSSESESEPRRSERLAKLPPSERSN